MAELMRLWLPILLATVGVFVWSFLSWMVLQIHRNDIRSLPAEANDAVMGLIRDKGIEPGMYMFPMAEDRKDFQSEWFTERFQSGPWGSLRVQGSQPNFGKNLALTALFYLVVSVLVGYVLVSAREPGAGFGSVFQIGATVAIMAYALGGMPNAIFFAKEGVAWATDLLDAVVMGLLTGAIFAALWPSAAAAS